MASTPVANVFEHAPGPARRVPSSWLASETLLADVGPRVAALVEERDPLGFAVSYHLARPGCWLGTRFGLAAGHALGLEPGISVALAAACELFHQAAVVSDDVEQRNALRRGQPALWTLFDPPLARRVAGLLHARALDAAARIEAGEARRLALIHRFHAASLARSRGRASEEAAAGGPSFALARYERSARATSGVLLALPVEGAALLGGLPEAACAAAAKSVSTLGVALRLQRDLENLFAPDATREAAVFARAKAPLVQFLSTAQPAERAQLQAFLSEGGSRRDCRYWSARVRSAPATAETLDRAQVLVERARAAFASLPPTLADVLAFAATHTTRSLTRLEASARRAIAGTFAYAPPLPVGD